MCIECTLSAPIAYSRFWLILYQFVHTIVPLYVKWWGRKIYIENGDDYLNVAEHIENAVLGLFWTMFRLHVLRYFQGYVLSMPYL